MSRSFPQLKNTAHLFVIALITSGLFATDISITNADFDEQVLADGAFTTDSVNAWTISGIAGTFNPTATHFIGETGDGARINTAFSNGGTLSQVLAETLRADHEYILQVLVGQRLDQPSPGFRINLLAGGVVIATDTDSVTPPAGYFQLAELRFSVPPNHAQLGQILEIELIGEGTQTNFDDVRLTATPLSPCTLFADDLIREDLTLNVAPAGDDFPSIQAALHCLAGKTILKGATVTIRVADGNYLNQTEIAIDHPQSHRLRIIGNEANPSNVKLEFNQANNGLSLQYNRTLLYLNGFELRGSGLSGDGLHVVGGSRLICGSAMVVTGFARGIYSAFNSTVEAAGINVSGNGLGMFVTYNSQAIVPNGIADDSFSGAGVEAIHNATVIFTGGKACRNANHGIVARSSASIDFSDGYAAENTLSGITSYAESIILARNATSIDNLRHGVEASTSSTNYIISATYSGNAAGDLSPPADTLGAGNSFNRTYD